MPYVDTFTPRASITNSPELERPKKESVEGEEDGTAVGVGVGIVMFILLAAVILVLTLILLVIYLRKRRNKKIEMITLDIMAM